MVLGVTGIIGSGKSLVGRLLAERGFQVVEADNLAREVVRPGSDCLIQISNSFGPDFLNNDGTLDRKRLGEKVFAEPEARRRLEAILHPAIRAAWLETLTKGSSTNIAYIVPLLFESGQLYPELDVVLLVAADRDVCLKRVMARDKLTALQASARLDSQLSVEEKIQLADHVIWNNSTEVDLAKQLDLFLKSRNSSDQQA